MRRSQAQCSEAENCLEPYIASAWRVCKSKAIVVLGKQENSMKIPHSRLPGPKKSILFLCFQLTIFLCVYMCVYTYVYAMYIYTYIIVVLLAGFHFFGDRILLHGSGWSRTWGNSCLSLPSEDLQTSPTTPGSNFHSSSVPLCSYWSKSLHF